MLDSYISRMLRLSTLVLASPNYVADAFPNADVERSSSLNQTFEAVLKGLQIVVLGKTDVMSG